MAISTDDRKLDTYLLRSLCHSDPSAWCFIPFGTSRISYCSDAFLKLWRLNQLRMKGDFVSVDLNGEMIRTALANFGITTDFLHDISVGLASRLDPSLLLVRNDGLQIRVSWMPVLTNEGLPGGRLVRFAPMIDHQLQRCILECVMNARNQLAALSDRELQILELLSRGHTNRVIAQMTEISEKTVEKHRSRIMQKLRASSSAELVRLMTLAKMIEDADDVFRQNVLNAH